MFRVIDLAPLQGAAAIGVRAGKDLSRGTFLKRSNFFLPAAHFALDNFFEAGRPFLDRP